MIPDLSLGGVLVPGLLAIACLALVLTTGVLRLLSAMGTARSLPFRPLVDLAILLLLLGLLVQILPAIGLFA